MQKIVHSYSVFLFIFFSFLALYPIQYAFDYVKKHQDINKVANSFSGKKGMKEPYFYLFRDGDKSMFLAESAIEEEESVYLFTNIRGNYNSKQEKYYYVSQSARYYAAQDYVDFVQGLNVSKEDGSELTGKRGAYKIREKLLRIFGDVKVSQVNRELSSDILTVNLNSNSYLAEGDVEFRLVDPENINNIIINSKSASLLEDQGILYLTDDVRVINNNQQLDSNKLIISYEKDPKGDFYISNMAGEGDVVISDSARQDKVKANNFNLSYQEPQSTNLEAKLYELKLSGNTSYVSDMRSESLTADTLIINFLQKDAQKQTKLESFVAEGNAHYLSGQRKEELKGNYIFAAFNNSGKKSQLKQIKAKENVFYNSILSQETITGEDFLINYQDGEINNALAKGNVNFNLESSKDYLKADSIELKSGKADKATKNLVARGDVVYLSGQRKSELRGRKFTMDLKKGKSEAFEASRLIGEKDIIYKSESEYVESDKMTYDKIKDFLKLEGNVKVKREEGIFNGDIFTYDFKTEVAELSSYSNSKANVQINKDVR